ARIDAGWTACVVGAGERGWDSPNGWDPTSGIERPRTMLARTKASRLALRFLILGATSVVVTSAAAQPQPVRREPLISRITLINVDGTSPTVVLETPRHFEAPNWSRDGTYLLLNSQGKLWRLPVAGGEPSLIPTDPVTRINNDHGISPDGRMFA